MLNLPCAIAINSTQHYSISDETKVKVDFYLKKLKEKMQETKNNLITNSTIEKVEEKRTEVTTNSISKNKNEVSPQSLVFWCQAPMEKKSIDDSVERKDPTEYNRYWFMHNKGYLKIWIITEGSITATVRTKVDDYGVGDEIVCSIQTDRKDGNILYSCGGEIEETGQIWVTVGYYWYDYFQDDVIDYTFVHSVSKQDSTSHTITAITDPPNSEIEFYGEGEYSEGAYAHICTPQRTWFERWHISGCEIIQESTAGLTLKVKNTDCLLTAMMNTCKKDSDCGTSKWVRNQYCWNGNIVRRWKQYTCNNPDTTYSSCSQAEELKTIKTCAHGCSHDTDDCIGVNPIPPIPKKECSVSSQCGKNKLLKKDYCKNNNVYWKFKEYYCSSKGKCGNAIVEHRVEICSNGCSNGECKQNGETSGGTNFCSLYHKCAEGKGDCDNDSDCKEGLICGENNGAKYGYDSSTDVCISSEKKDYTTHNYSEFTTPVLKLKYSSGRVNTLGSGTEAGWDYNITTKGEFEYGAFNGAPCGDLIMNQFWIPTITTIIEAKHQTNGDEIYRKLKMGTYLYEYGKETCWIITEQDEDEKYLTCKTHCGKNFKEVLETQLILAPHYSFHLNSAIIDKMATHYETYKWITNEDEALMAIIIGASTTIIGIYIAKRAFAPLACFVLAPLSGGTIGGLICAGTLI